MTDLSVSTSPGGLLTTRGPNSTGNNGTRNNGAAMVAAALLGIGALWLAGAIGANQAALFLVGGALGLTLYHASFGFTSAFRVLIADRRGAGLRAQMLMLAIACALFFPVLADGSLFGQPKLSTRDTGAKEGSVCHQGRL